MNRAQLRRSSGARYSIPQRVLVWLLFTSALYAGGQAPQQRVPKPDPLGDVTAALAALPDALVLDSSPDGLPRHIVGDLARVDVDRMNDPATAEPALRAVLARVVAPFRIAPSDLRLRGVRRDHRGGTHFRFHLVVDGLDVIGGDLVVHVDAKGSVVGVTGAGGGDFGRLPTARLTDAEASPGSRRIPDSRDWSSLVSGRSSSSPRRARAIVLWRFSLSARAARTRLATESTWT
jgi:hypothetical protein